MNTPRTDEKTFTGGRIGKGEYVAASFCRQLETELADMREALENLCTFDTPLTQEKWDNARAILEKIK